MTDPLCALKTRFPPMYLQAYAAEDSTEPHRLRRDAEYLRAQQTDRHTHTEETERERERQTDTDGQTDSEERERQTDREERETERRGRKKERGERQTDRERPREIEERQNEGRGETERRDRERGVRIERRESPIPQISIDAKESADQTNDSLGSTEALSSPFERRRTRAMRSS